MINISEAAAFSDGMKAFYNQYVSGCGHAGDSGAAEPERIWLPDILRSDGENIAAGPSRAEPEEIFLPDHPPTRGAAFGAGGVVRHFFILFSHKYSDHGRNIRCMDICLS